MEYQDRSLKCRDCGQDFVFTAGEQAFYATKGFENDPARCTSCRTARKRTVGAGSSSGRSEHTFQEVICAECGQLTQVPFVPRQGRPVYCRQCLDAKNRTASIS